MATAADSRTVSLTMPAKPEYIVLARLALSAVCRLTSLPPDDVADLKLGITEAASVLVGTEPTDVSIGFEFVLEDDRLVLAVEGPPGGVPTDGGDPDERELAHAILRATADECDIGDHTVRIVKFLRSPGE